MKQKKTVQALCTFVSLGIMLALLVLQATVAMKETSRPTFSVDYRTIVYGYHSTNNLCNGNDHLPDGIVASPEQCDDGNTSNTDGCLNTCKTAICGDGFLREGTEQCEPPGSGTCSASCTIQTGVGGGTSPVPPSITPEEIPEELKRKKPPLKCGNAVIDPGESCDLGTVRNLFSPECDAWCGIRHCGDGFVHPDTEECEPDKDAEGSYIVNICGGKSCTAPDCNDDGCRGGCRWVFLPRCSEPPLPPSSSQESVFFPFPAATSSSQPMIITMPPMPPYARSSAPTSDPGDFIIPLSTCGNRLVENNEECDDGNLLVGDGCTPLCTRAICGNGILEDGEECDEGMRNSEMLPDTCSIGCLMPRCGDGIADPAFGELCDHADRNGNTPNRCRLNCLVPLCGDAILDDGEECDDGNNLQNDGCSTVCTKPICGNNLLELQEECDDGNLLNGDACNAMCMREGSFFWELLYRIFVAPFYEKSPEFSVFLLKIL